ncbi:T9SS type A sorting domain-containing protein [Rufibacter ruber]|uniref:T9SS type A sorting domain-containing protein n=1 Tax=Rufibacter ruber TaxID=1783499 RepID=UPI0008345C01|nr:T9SS type A sorting domain-containing protein [Rufibacter ruber]
MKPLSPVFLSFIQVLSPGSRLETARASFVSRLKPVKPFLSALALGTACLTTSVVSAQSPYAVNAIITDYNGFWRSGVGSINPVKPDNSHNLLAYTYNGVTYSTGANDAKLTANGVVFIPGQYQAIPVSTLPAPVSNTKVALGQLYDGVHAGASNPAPARDMARYLTDGLSGLDIGTGVANLPAGRLTFPFTQIVKETIGDGMPDVLVTQIADPDPTRSDVYKFFDANNNQVGTSVSIVFDATNIPAVGNWQADFYEASQNPMTLQTSFTNGQRSVRLWAADFSVFGITQANYTQISRFEITLSGNSDLAFVAYNTAVDPSVVGPLPVTFSGFSGRQEKGLSQLYWQTASETMNDHFEVEAGTDGKSFQYIGEVKGAGNSTTLARYRFTDPTPRTGITYYRLKQVDVDGKFEYSRVISVEAKATAGGTASPNPVTKDFTFTHGLATGQEQLQVLDAHGRLVRQQNVVAGTTATLVPAKTLAPGLYHVLWISENTRKVTRLVKQ